MAFALLFLAALWAGAPATAEAPSGDVRTANTNRGAEQLKTIPISKNRGGKPRSVISLKAEKLGSLSNGDRVEGAAEVQVQVCLKPNPKHRASRGDCVGPIYGYDPRVAAHLALAQKKSHASPRKTTKVTPVVVKKCNQRRHARNHHCLITVPWDGIKIDRSKLKCPLSDCRLNLILSAYDRQAKGGHKLIIGGADSRGRVEGGKGKVSSARFRPAKIDRPAPVVDRTPRSRKLKVQNEGRSPKLKVIYSKPVRNLRAGEDLVVQGRYLSNIKHLPYNVRTRLQIVLAKSPNSTQHNSRRARRAAATDARITEETNFNCTHKPSGHQSPCPVDKVGIVRIARATTKPLFVNLIAGHGALIDSDQSFKGGSARIPKSGGWLKIWRYAP